MTLLQILILALVQGVTEFLPVSSSAHLIIAGQLLGWPDQGLLMDVAVHLGSLVAVIVYFRAELKAVISGGPSLEFPGLAARTLAGWLLIATVPLVIAGAFFATQVATGLRDFRVIAWASIGFGVLLGLADVWGRRRPQATEMTRRRALLMGLSQVLALIPGVSRSGITITAGLTAGLDRRSAARFAFLMAIPALGAAGGYAVATLIRASAAIDPTPFLIATGASALGAWLCIGAFLRLVNRIGMLPFVIYRLALGALMLALG